MLPVETPATTTPVRRNRVRSPRTVNSRIKAGVTGNDRWWEHNQGIIDYLDQGLTVKKIAVLTGRGERIIRAIRERVRDSPPVDAVEDDESIGSSVR